MNFIFFKNEISQNLFLKRFFLLNQGGKNEADIFKRELSMQDIRSIISSRGV